MFVFLHWLHNTHTNTDLLFVYVYVYTYKEREMLYKHTLYNLLYSISMNILSVMDLKRIFYFLKKIIALCVLHCEVELLSLSKYYSVLPNVHVLFSLSVLMPSHFPPLISPHILLYLFSLPGLLVSAP